MTRCESLSNFVILQSAIAIGADIDSCELLSNFVILQLLSRIWERISEL